MQLLFGVSIESTADDTTVIPVIKYDEGMAGPSSYKANPRNPSFAESNSPSCYPDSLISNFECKIRVQLTKKAMETDKIQSLNYAHQVIHPAFLEDLTPKDEKTGLSIENILHLTHETTDRQTSPIYDGLKLSQLASGTADLHADVLGLTTDQQIENSIMNLEQYYDALQYSPLAPKLRKVQSGVKWETLSKNKLFKTHKFFLKSNIKRMNEYAALMIRLIIPDVDNIYQPIDVADTTAIDHLIISFYARYLEWNENFNFERA